MEAQPEARDPHHRALSEAQVVALHQHAADGEHVALSASGPVDAGGGRAARGDEAAPVGERGRGAGLDVRGLRVEVGRGGGVAAEVGVVLVGRGGGQAADVGFVGVDGRGVGWVDGDGVVGGRVGDGVGCVGVVGSGGFRERRLEVEGGAGCYAAGRFNLVRIIELEGQLSAIGLVAQDTALRFRFVVSNSH